MGFGVYSFCSLVGNKMSRLLKEDDDYLYLVEYVHNNSDSYSDWMIDEYKSGDDFLKYPEPLIIAADLACYEIKVSYKVNKHTYEITYDEITP